MLHCVTLCCTVLHCVTLCYTVLHCVALCLSLTSRTWHHPYRRVSSAPAEQRRMRQRPQSLIQSPTSGEGTAVERRPRPQSLIMTSRRSEGSGGRTRPGKCELRDVVSVIMCWALRGFRAQRHQSPVMCCADLGYAWYAAFLQCVIWKWCCELCYGWLHERMLLISIINQF